MSLRQSTADLATTLLAIVRTRLELFSFEAAEQKSHLMGLAALFAGAAILLLLALGVFTAAFVVAVWPTEYRYMAL